MPLFPISPGSGSGGGSSGVSVVNGGTETELTTTDATVVATYTPSTTGAYRLACYIRVITGTTNLTLVYAWNDGGAQTETVYNVEALTVGVYSVTEKTVLAGSGGAISITATAGTANRIFVTPTIEQLA